MKYIGFDLKLPKRKTDGIDLYDDESLILTDLFGKSKPFKIEFECFNFGYDRLIVITDEQYNYFLTHGLEEKIDYYSFIEKYNFYEHLI